MKTSKKKIIALCGSTRKTSSNLNLIKAIADLSQDRFEIELYDGLALIPHFNPDLDHAEPPAEVQIFREQLRAADGILICTPEYAMGVPGTLKNAIDWTVSSMEFTHKPTALITASTLGQMGHDSLLATLKIIDSGIIDETSLLISQIKTKLNSQCVITDAATLSAVNQLILAFDLLIEKQ